MCEWFCNVLENDENFLENVWFSDEAHFLLSGHVNSKNNVLGGSEVPDEVLQRPLHSVKCTAWVAMESCDNGNVIETESVHSGMICRKIGLQGEYLLLICPRHFGGNYSCKRSSMGSPFTSCNRKDIR